MRTTALATTPVRAVKAEARRSGLAIVTFEGEYLIPWGECSERLATATSLQRKVFELLPAGIGIHWPLLDEDLAVGPLIRGRKPTRAKSHA